ncbi:hypothetical protein J2Z23_004172 [Lederbergia galactosidilyticus]|uniref:hypothetical protein n=1 Tax=Lederbergia galactosidilytica TaxID=217031 RepID=UPI001AE230B9|nr:hypothetical protein [Lederbergia galactosidilytica]MBP1917187.1 hypothetical protein [Lederbergia galactosidilytica]
MARRSYQRRQTNKLKWTADLLKLGEYTDPENDRIKIDYLPDREIKYNNIGVTVTDNAFVERDTDKIVKKIEVRIDRKIEDNRKDYRIKIRDRIYNIGRTYVREEDRIMEVSLSYAN